MYQRGEQQISDSIDGQIFHEERAMSEDPNFRVISGGNIPSDDEQNTSETTLGLALMKNFLALSREQKRQVIEFTDRLASPPRSIDD